MRVYIVLGITDYLYNQRVVIEKVFLHRRDAKAYIVDKEAKAKVRWFKIISKELINEY